MLRLKSNLRTVGFLGLLMGSLTLSGCASDDVAIDVPLVGNILATKKEPEKKMVRRAPLVMPPVIDSKLPAPNDTAATQANQAWPADPDLKARKEAALAAAKEKHYREHGNFKDWKDIEDFEKNLDPMSRQKGLLSGTNIFQ